MKKKIVIPILIALIGIPFILFVAIQFIPYGHQHTNPPVVSEPKWDSPQTRAIAQKACFDCHSNETVWPWYSNIAPVSWLIQHDAEEGRQNMNFSEWDTMGLNAGEVIEVVSEGRMPPSQYLLIHTDAKLSAAEKEQFLRGLEASLK